jgi:biopolymer transport protein ExbB
MFVLYEALRSIEAFMASGGWVLTAIFFLTIVMWLLIVERLFYFHSQLKKDTTLTQSRWGVRKDKQSWYAHQIRDAWISQIHLKIDTNLTVIKTLVMLCPLFGLLGTVTGMIEVFEVMAITGGGDAKAMAGGVSKATIPTMAGMVAALSGVLGNTIVEKIAGREKELFRDSLTSQ